MRGNILEHNWVAAQTGYAVVFTPRNSSGTNPWVVIEDVEFSGNVLRRSSAGFNILGYDNTARSGQLARVRIADNLMYDIGGGTWGGSGIFAQLGGEPRDVTFDHNTVLQGGHILSLYSGSIINASGAQVPGGPIVGLVFTNNLIKHNAYGIFGSGQAYGNGSLNYYAPGAVVRRNVIGSDKSVTSRYPTDNQFPTVAVFMTHFLNPNVKDYRLITSSTYIDAGLDELGPGVFAARGADGGDDLGHFSFVASVRLQADHSRCQAKVGHHVADGKRSSCSALGRCCDRKATTVTAQTENRSQRRRTKARSRRAKRGP